MYYYFKLIVLKVFKTFLNLTTKIHGFFILKVKILFCFQIPTKKLSKTLHLHL